MAGVLAERGEEGEERRWRGQETWRIKRNHYPHTLFATRRRDSWPTLPTAHSGQLVQTEILSHADGESRNIQSPLSRLLPNSEYASSRQAWMADRLGQANVSTTCALARLEKCLWRWAGISAATSGLRTATTRHRRRRPAAGWPARPRRRI